MEMLSRVLWNPLARWPPSRNRQSKRKRQHVDDGKLLKIIVGFRAVTSQLHVTASALPSSS